MSPLSGVKCVVAITGGKGGVGKTTLAVNLASAFAQDGLKVGLLDLDLTGPSVPIMLSAPQTGASPGSLVPREIRGIRVMSAPYFAPGELISGWQEEKTRDAVRRLVTEVPWGALDILFVDLPPGGHVIASALVANVPLKGIVLVATPQDVVLQEVQASLEEFRKQKVEILGLVENMSFYVCASCGHRDNIFGHGSAADLAHRLGVAYLGAIPIDSEVRKCSDSGMPVVLKQQESPAREALRHVVKNLSARLAA